MSFCIFDQECAVVTESNNLVAYVLNIDWFDVCSTLIEV